MVSLTGQGLSLDRFAQVVFGKEVCELATDARQKVEQGRATVERLVELGEPAYGINTGFGKLSNQTIPPEQTAELQTRLLLSHAAGVGKPLGDTAVRGMLLLRANTLARGYSGVRPELIDRLLDFLNHDLLPVVPSTGSVGASGDLAPLAHLALPLIGRGRVRFRGRELPGIAGLQELGLEPLSIQAKEGLALINGTQAMTSLLALGALETRRLVRIADLVGALSTDATRGTDQEFDRRLHELRPHPGQLASARNLWSLLAGSEIRESHRTGDHRVQDAYSFRCMPQVHGAVRDVLADTEEKLEIEFNSVTDNPFVFSDPDEVLSGGNFHGEPMALAADFLAIAVSELGAISERRVEKLTNSAFSRLPPFLVENSGLNSGFMIAQVTAAALASENKGFAHPASVDSIPTSADKEDHVSMGMGAALKLASVTNNVRLILAIELLCAAQGVDFLRPLNSSKPLEALHSALRTTVKHWDETREMASDIQAAAEFLSGPIDDQLAPLE